MSDLELKIYLKKIKAHRKKILSSKAKSKKFLIELGVIDSDGKLTDFYKDLVIPIGPDKSHKSSL